MALRYEAQVDLIGDMPSRGGEFVTEAVERVDAWLSGRIIVARDIRACISTVLWELCAYARIVD